MLFLHEAPSFPGTYRFTCVSMAVRPSSWSQSLGHPEGGATIDILLMIQKSGETTTWDGAKTPVNHGIVTIYQLLSRIYSINSRSRECFVCVFLVG